MPAAHNPAVEIIGSTCTCVEFRIEKHRVVAFADGEIRAFDDDACEDVAPTEEEIRQAKRLVRSHLRKAHVFAGRAMKGPGVDY